MQEGQGSAKTTVHQRLVPESAGVCYSHDGMMHEFLVDSNPKILNKKLLKLCYS